MGIQSFHMNHPRGRLDFPMEYLRVDEHSPLYILPLHWHKEWEFIHILQGSMDMMINSQEFHAEEGDFFLLDEGCIHGGIPHNGIYECVIFDPRTLFHQQPLFRKQLQPNYNQQRSLPTVFPKNDEAGKNLLCYFFSLMENQGIGREMEVFGSLCMILGHIDKNNYWLPRKTSSASSRKLSVMKEFMDYLEENYTRALTLNDLAEKAGMTPRYFCRFFKEMTGKPPMEYLNYYRIEMAGIELLTTKKSVTEIAFDNGFHDLNYFIRAFKKQMGVTPGQYMHQNALPRASEITPRLSETTLNMLVVEKDLVNKHYPKLPAKKKHTKKD